MELCLAHVADESVSGSLFIIFVFLGTGKLVPLIDAIRAPKLSTEIALEELFDIK